MNEVLRTAGGCFPSVMPPAIRRRARALDLPHPAQQALSLRLCESVGARRAAGGPDLALDALLIRNAREGQLEAGEQRAERALQLGHEAGQPDAAMIYAGTITVTACSGPGAEVIALIERVVDLPWSPRTRRVRGITDGPGSAAGRPSASISG